MPCPAGRSVEPIGRAPPVASATVGDVKVLRTLGAGLQQRAIDAVRQWRFGPARREGTPVDVVVEVSVEFKLR